jgi:hypothetical protein
VIGNSLNLGKAYGFSVSSEGISKDAIIKKSSKENTNNNFSFFFEEEDINESEDDSILELPLLSVNNSSKLFTHNLDKVQKNSLGNFLYFQVYPQPLFIVFRNLRL